MTKKILTIALSVVLALALWFYVVMFIGPEYQDTFRDIPVTFVGEPSSDLMIRNMEGHKVTLDLSGNRSDLNKLSASNITVTVDLSTVTEAGNRAYRYDVSFPGNVAKNAVIVQRQEPAGIILEVDRVMEKPVDISVVYDGPLPENYVKTPDPELEPVRIKGPENIINQIEYAKVIIQSDTVPTDDITGSFEYRFYDKNDKEVDASGITPGQEDRTVSVTYPIRVTKEVLLGVDIKYGGGATEENTSYVIEPATITVSGKQAELKDLNVLMLGVIDLSTMNENEIIHFSIEEKLKEISPNVKNASGDPEATVSVAFPDLTIKDFHVTQFQAINQPEGMVCSIRSNGMKVTVRGSKSVVEAMASSDITIIVDFTGVALGSQYLEVTAVIKNNPVDVGVYRIPDDVLVLVEDAAVVAAREAAEAAKNPIITPIKN